MSAYKDIEFVCVNPGHPAGTPPERAARLYGLLKGIPGLVVVRQDFSEAGHLAMRAIVHEGGAGTVQAVLQAAEEAGVAVDLIQEVGDRVLDAVFRGDEEAMVDAFLTTEGRGWHGVYGLPSPDETGWALAPGGSPASP